VASLIRDRIADLVVGKAFGYSQDEAIDGLVAGAATGDRKAGRTRYAGWLTSALARRSHAQHGTCAGPRGRVLTTASIGNGIYTHPEQQVRKFQVNIPRQSRGL
jgi:hypothetical protein